LHRITSAVLPGDDLLVFDQHIECY